MLQPLSSPDVAQSISSADREFQHRADIKLLKQHWLGWEKD
jgi:hypothetical protein